MPRAADKPHNRAIILFCLAILIFFAFFIRWDFGDLVYMVTVVGISTYITSLIDGRGALYMLTHPGQEIRLEGQTLLVKTLKTEEETTYALEDFQGYSIKSIFSDRELKFLNDVIGDVHLIPKDKYRFPIKIIKVRDYKGLGEALRGMGMEEKNAL